MRLPDLVARKAAAHGAAGEQWLHDLPRHVAELEREWHISVGAPLPGGTSAFVAPVTKDDGTQAILKIALPAFRADDHSYEHELCAYRLADGRGCARVFAAQPEIHALLLERLGPNLDALGLPVYDQLPIICRTVRQMWVPAPTTTPLRTGAEKARWLAAEITSMWERLDRPCSRAAIDLALEYAAARATAFDPGTAVLVHGDAHGFNTLRARGDDFKLVDPEGLVSEPAHDLAIPMREHQAELLAGDVRVLLPARARRLSRLTGVDEHAIWQWGFIERVSTGLYALTLGYEAGTEFLTVADRWIE